MNKTITIYELLGLIKDGKAPKMIKYKDNNYIFTGYDYRCILTDIEKGFVEYWLIGNYNQELNFLLNEKIEILEEDKPIIEKIEIEEDFVCNKYIENEHGARCHIKSHDKIIIDKLNEVIEFLNDKFNN